MANGNGNSKDYVPLLILGAIGLYTVNKLFGEDKPPDEIPLPDNGQGIPEGWSAVPLAAELFKVLDGPTFFTEAKQKRDGVIMQFTGLASNDMFVAVYNQFNLSYGGGKTLRNWIDSEVGINDAVKAAVDLRFNQNSLAGFNRRGLPQPFPGANKDLNIQLYKTINCVNEDIDFLAQCI